MRAIIMRVTTYIRREILITDFLVLIYEGEDKTEAEDK